LNDPHIPPLDAHQLSALESSFHQGSAEASRALAAWIGKPSVVETDTLEQLPLEAATTVLGTGGEPICYCVAEMRGLLAGELILAFDDASGMALADILLDRPPGTTDAWTELTTSAALETTNILCCSYLNSLSRILSRGGESPELLPSPPRFSHEFAESLLEFALMGQAVASHHVMVARTRFEVDETPVNWTLLFVPDADSMIRLRELLENVQ
jgi:chemotaxis protein CheC